MIVELNANMDTTTIEILKEARRRIIEKGWSQGALYRDFKGEPIIFSKGRVICSFCTMGAVLFSSKGMNSYYTDRALEVLERFVPDGLIPRWNDDPTRTKEEVIALFDRAIESVTK